MVHVHGLNHLHRIVAHSMLEEVHDNLEQLLAAGVICHTNSIR